MTRRRSLAHCTVLLAWAVAGVSNAFAAPAVAPTATAAHDSAATTSILVVGDSLSAEYGLQRGTGWVALLEKRLAAERVAAQVGNASISGETTAGGRARLPALLRERKPDVVVLELGANDALRGLPLESTQANLAAMAHAAKQAGARVLIVGMHLPPNYGRRYGDQFAALFATVAHAEGAALVPFMLKGVADSAHAETLFQPDRIHPLASAHPTILANIWPALRTLLPK
jgi:acyl-CoA thioesterase I